MTELLFSVVIPTFQRPDLLSACLEGLKPGFQTMDSQSYEVIVTDDGQSILAEAMITEQYPWVRWVPGPQRGAAANRNNGIQAAKGQWLVFTDDDCLPDRGWLAAFQKALNQNPEACVLEGKTYAEREQQSMAESAPINDAGGNLWSCNMAICRKAIETVQGFDERFPYAMLEDIDLRIRLTEAGYTLQFVPEATVCHPWRVVNNYVVFKKRIFSMQLFWDLHPQQRPTFYQHLNLLSRVIIKDRLPRLLRYKGAGFQYVFWDIVYSIKLIFLELRHVKYTLRDNLPGQR
jgi:GT2 family glycosyltransferase